MKSSSGVLCISIVQLAIGICLLGVYESYKVSYMNADPRQKVNLSLEDTDADQSVEIYSVGSVSTPLDWLFYLSIFNNIFCLFFCLAGALNSFREVVIGFFAFNGIQVVLAFHFFVDVWTDARVRNWSSGDLGGYEKSATALLFFDFAISLIATVFAVTALQEIKHKAREEYNRLSVISDNLHFEADTDKF